MNSRQYILSYPFNLKSYLRQSITNMSLTQKKIVAIIILFSLQNIMVVTSELSGVSVIPSNANRRMQPSRGFSNNGAFHTTNPALKENIRNIIGSVTGSQNFHGNPNNARPIFIDARIENRGDTNETDKENSIGEDIIPMEDGHHADNTSHSHTVLHSHIENKPSIDHGIYSHAMDDHDHIHLPAETTDKELGRNIERFDENIILNKTNWKTGNSDNNLLPRLGREDQEYELCNHCLCNNNHTWIFCQGDVFQTEGNELTLDASLIPLMAKYISISGYNKVIVMNETFSNPDQRLQYLEFEDIQWLDLKIHSLHFSQKSIKNIEVKITFKSCYIPVLKTYTLTQLVHTEHESDTNILAPEDTRYLTLMIYRCRIGEIRPRALYLARLLYFNITDTTIEKMSTKSIDLSIYQEWIVQDSKLPTLPTKSICIHAKKSVVFARNTIEKLEPYALNIEAAGQVLFNYNTVEIIEGFAFQNITPELNSLVANIVFVNNTVLVAEPDSLVTSDLYPQHERKVLDNKFEVACKCNISSAFKELLDIKDDVTSDYLMHKAVLLTSLCRSEVDSSKYVPIHRYLRTECSEVPIIKILMSVVIVVVLIMSITIAGVCARKAKLAQEEISYMGECSSRSFSTLNTHAAPLSPAFGDNKNIFYDAAGNPSWIVAVPEVKTYQETEVNVTYEESEPIRNSIRNSNLEPGYNNNMLEMEGRNLNTRQSCPFN